ncbi:MAG TPA: hypothetical protein VGL97_20465 [Bryobacteraceae bacterium]
MRTPDPGKEQSGKQADYSLKTTERTNGKRAGTNAGALLEDGKERAQLRI